MSVFSFRAITEMLTFQIVLDESKDFIKNIECFDVPLEKENLNLYLS